MSLVTLAGLPMFGSILAFGETRPLVQLNWVLPVAQSFVILSALAIAFLCLARYAALGGPWTYWAGAVFLSSSILGTFYLLSWPGLLGDSGLIARLSNTAAWFFFMTFSCLALLAIVAAAGPDTRPKPIGRAYRLYATSAFLAIVVGVLSLAFEDSLPQLVAGLSFSPLDLAWVFVLSAIMGFGALAAYRRYRKEHDAFLGYLALFLILTAFGILYSALGGKRYDAWWYASRIVYPLGFMAMLFGLLQEGYALFRREMARVEERSQLLKEIELLAGVAQRRASELETVIESMADAVIVCDVDGNIILANSAAISLLGKTAGEPLGTVSSYAGALQLSLFNGQRILPGEMAISRALHRGEVIQEQEEVATHPLSGRRIVKLVSAAPLRDRDGRIFGAVQIAGEITRLRELQERQEEYVTLIGHDLRSPLTSILGRAQMLQRSLSKQQLVKEAEMSEAIATSARQIDAMIRELVESARLEQDELEMTRESVDIIRLLSGLVDTIGTPVDRSRVLLKLPQEPITVVGDPNRLERVLTNLITNALKYSAEDMPVHVRVEEMDGQVAVTVRDQGVGIPPEDLPRVFERDFRSKTAGEREGLGLGLYIALLITRAHGGTITADSEEGKGSTFRLMLPRDQVKEETSLGESS